MSNGQTVDPQNEFTQAFGKIDAMHHSKRTPALLKEADTYRWLGGVYADEQGHVVLPADNYTGSLIKAAKVHRLGPKAKSGIMVIDDARLDFKDSDKKVEELEKDPTYTSRIPTSRGVIAHRPIFADWSAEFTVEFEDEVISPAEFQAVLDTAGFTGVGAWASRYGKFTTEVKK